MLGDTGCRVTSYFDQECGDPDKWPFAQVADAAAAKGPGADPASRRLLLPRDTVPSVDMVNCVQVSYGDRARDLARRVLRAGANLLPRRRGCSCAATTRTASAAATAGTTISATASVISLPAKQPAGRKSAACEQVSDESIIPFAGLTLVNVDSAHADDRIRGEGDRTRTWKSIADSVRCRGPRERADRWSSHDSRCRPISSATTDCDKEAIADVRRRPRHRRTAAREPAGARSCWRGMSTPSRCSTGAAGLTEVIVGNGGADLDKFPAAVPPTDSGAIPFADGAAPARDWMTVVSNERRLGARRRSGRAFGFGILTPCDPGSVDVRRRRPADNSPARWPTPERPTLP